MKLPNVRKISWSSYRRIRALSSTFLKAVYLDGPRAAYWQKKHPKESTAFDFGSAVHCCALEPEDFLAEYVRQPDHISTRRGRVWDVFLQEHWDRTILKPDEYDRATAIGQSLRSHPIAGPFMKARGREEVSVVWEHPATRQVIKCRLDKLHKKWWLDIKTARAIDPRRFATSFAQYGYDIQFALYGDAVAAAGLGALPAKCIAVDPMPPHDVVVYDIPEEVLNVGRLKYEAAIDTVIKCESSGKWPGIADDKELTLHLPAWAVDEAELELTFDGEEMAL